MDPRQISEYIDGNDRYPVTICVNDINGMSIGKVQINGKDRYVVRWNGDSSNIGFPQSHGNPVWMLLAEGIKLSIDL